MNDPLVELEAIHRQTVARLVQKIKERDERIVALTKESYEAR